MTRVPLQAVTSNTRNPHFQNIATPEIKANGWISSFCLTLPRPGSFGPPSVLRMPYPVFSLCFSFFHCLCSTYQEPAMWDTSAGCLDVVFSITELETQLITLDSWWQCHQSSHMHATQVFSEDLLISFLWRTGLCIWAVSWVIGPWWDPLTNKMLPTSQRFPPHSLLLPGNILSHCFEASFVILKYLSIHFLF